jgi:predicted aldo/keto reductase-like oxidoreductase
MDNFSLIDSYVAASGKRINRSDLAVLKKYRQAASSSYCRMDCSACEQSCPEEVAISDIMRFNMYYKDYGHKDKARLQYNALKLAQKPILCGTCSGYCTQACPYGLQVKNQLLRIHSLLLS